MFKWFKPKPLALGKTTVKDTTGGKLAPFLVGALGIAAVFGTANLAYETRKDGIYISPVALTAQVAKDFDAVFNAAMPGQYRGATIHLTEGKTQTPCGEHNLSTGPFYCQTNEGIYNDPTWFTVLCAAYKGCLTGVSREAQYIYVLAHEMAHHATHLTKGFDAANALWAKGDALGYNKASVIFELRADCLTGFYIQKAFDGDKRTRETLSKSGLYLANAIGDDMLNPAAPKENHQHGTGAQRQAAFSTGFKSPNINACF